MLSVLPGALAAASTRLVKNATALPQVGEFFRFVDPATEAPVVRLTNPATTSLLPASSNRFVSSKRRFLIFSSDRTGMPAPFEVDLRTGRLRQLGETSHLRTDSLSMDTKARVLYFIERGALKEVTLANLKARTLADDVTAFDVGTSASDAVVVKRDRLEDLNRGIWPSADHLSSASRVLLRPNGSGCFFSRDLAPGEREFWYAPFPPGSKPTLLARGRISNPFWSPDGHSLLFLRDVEKNVLLSEVHEVVPESGVEQPVAPTSQFVAFAPNGDASVFVGASRSKAQPNVILLLRSVQRELTLCEHQASHPLSVSPVFSPDSRRVYFQSDHQGKSALYSVNVEKLVEPTPASY